MRLALSIRQPFAELILRGIKTVEYRSRLTRVVGERFWIYAPKKLVADGQRPVAAIWSRDLSLPGEAMPGWMLELAEQVGMIEPGTLLPTGVIVGSAVIEKCVCLTSEDVKREGVKPQAWWGWHLSGVERLAEVRPPKGRPQPVWFRDSGGAV